MRLATASLLMSRPDSVFNALIWSCVTVRELGDGERAREGLADDHGDAVELCPHANRGLGVGLRAGTESARGAGWESGESNARTKSASRLGRRRCRRIPSFS